jgi:hypothetical protein
VVDAKKLVARMSDLTDVVLTGPLNGCKVDDEALKRRPN